MTNITLHDRGLLSITCIPNIFIDEYMVNASGAFVKVYLYLLRKIQVMDNNFSVSALADVFDYTESDVLRALSYWEKVGLLHLEYDAKNQLADISLMIPDVQTPEPVSVPSMPEQTAVSNISESSALKESYEKNSYTAEQVENFQDNEDVQEILFITENYLGRTLNSTDVRTILYWYDALKFSPDLIEYLIETCISNGHTSLRYMEKIALSWADAGISTVAEARNEHNLHNQDVYAVMKAFGINGRNLIQTEVDTIRKWTGSYAFSMDIIKEACRRTIQAIGKPSFEYADKILSNWHQNNIHNLNDVVKLDAAHQKSRSAAKSKSTTERASNSNRFNNFPQRTYNYEQLEKQLLKN